MPLSINKTNAAKKRPSEVKERYRVQGARLKDSKAWGMGKESGQKTAAVGGWRSAALEVGGSRLRLMLRRAKEGRLEIADYRLAKPAKLAKSALPPR